jgi:hypothetical protein
VRAARSALLLRAWPKDGAVPGIGEAVADLCF